MNNAVPAAVSHMKASPSELWYAAEQAQELCVAWQQLLPKQGACHSHSCRCKPRTSEQMMPEFLAKLLLKPMLAAMDWSSQYSCVHYFQDKMNSETAHLRRGHAAL